MKRIAIDARESGTSTGRYIDKLIEHIHTINPGYEIIIMTKSHRLDYMKQIAPNFKSVAADFKEFTFSEQLGFLQFCRKQKADLIHFPMVQQPLLYGGKTVTTMNDLTTLRFKNPARNPLIFTIKQKIYGWGNKRAAEKSAHLITYTQYVKDDVVDYTGVAPQKITPIYLAADIILEKAAPIKQMQDKQFIMYVGRPFPHKNLRRLIDAFALLQEDHPELHLILAGKTDAVYEQHLVYIKERGIRNIMLTDFVSEGELKWLYQNCSAYVFPSLSEGFGLPGLEAMRHGAPVVSSSATCLPEVYGQAAHYFDPLDTDDIAQKIHEVIADKKLQSKLREAGAQHIKRFSWQKTAKETLKVYEKALKS